MQGILVGLARSGVGSVCGYCCQMGPGSHLFFLPFQFVLKNYGENPENYNEELRKLEVLRQVRAALLASVLPTGSAFSSQGVSCTSEMIWAP